MSDQKPRHVNLIDLAAFLVRWRRFLTAVVFSVAIPVAIISLVLTPRYRSIAVIRAAEGSSGSGLGGLISSKLTSLGAFANFLPSLGEVPGELFVSILRSRWMFERVIEEFDLKRAYKLEDAPMEDVIQVIQSRTNFQLEPLSQTIEIYVDDESPQKCRDMAQFLVDELDNRNQQLRSSNARMQREYLGQRLEVTQFALATLEDSMVGFQLHTGIFDPDEQVKATISAAAALEAERLSTQVELEMNRHLYDYGMRPGLPELKVASIDSALQQLSRGQSTKNKNWDMLLHLQDAPQQALTYLRLKRDIEIQQLLAAFLIQQHEQAKLDEKRNTPTLLRLDPPVVPTKRSWPRRGLMVGGAAFCALIFGIGVALIVEFISAARNPAHPQHERIEQVRNSWTRVRRSA